MLAHVCIKLAPLGLDGLNVTCKRGCSLTSHPHTGTAVQSDFTATLLCCVTAQLLCMSLTPAVQSIVSAFTGASSTAASPLLVSGPHHQAYCILQSLFVCTTHLTWLVILQADGDTISSIHNQALGPFLRNLAANHTELSVIMFDYATWQQALVANATASGFTNTTHACYTEALEGDSNGICDNPEEYIYWDGGHFSGHTHRLWGEAVAAQLEQYMNTTATVSTTRRGKHNHMNRHDRQ